MTDCIEVANKIASAVAKKFPKYTPYVRLVDCGTVKYIEIALRPEGGSYVNELTTAYDSGFFESATKDNIKDKAHAVYDDFKRHFGKS